VSFLAFSNSNNLFLSRNIQIIKAIGAVITKVVIEIILGVSAMILLIISHFP